MGEPQKSLSLVGGRASEQVHDCESFNSRGAHSEPCPQSVLLMSLSAFCLFPRMLHSAQCGSLQGQAEVGRGARTNVTHRETSLMRVSSQSEPVSALPTKQRTGQEAPGTAGLPRARCGPALTGHWGAARGTEGRAAENLAGGCLLAQKWPLCQGTRIL